MLPTYERDINIFLVEYSTPIFVEIVELSQIKIGMISNLVYKKSICYWQV